MKYLLLSKHVTPGDPCKVGWELFEDEAAAVKAKKDMEETSKRYGWMAGVYAPGLISAVVLKIEEIQ